MMSLLTPEQRSFLGEARTATLASVDGQGRPRLVPICFALAPDDAGGRPVLYSPLDEKPKRTSDMNQVARVKDIRVRPDVTVLVDRWDEDWSRLAWLRLYGTAELLEPQSHELAERAVAIELLRHRYPQYAEQALETRPIIRMRIDRAVAWSADPVP